MVSGRTLQVDTSNIQDIDGLGEFQYSWFNSADGISWQEIDGEDEAAYTLTSNDVSRYIKVKTTFVDQQGFFEEFSTHSERTVLGGVDGREPGQPIIGGVDEDYIDGTQTDDDVIAGEGDDQVITGQGSDVVDGGAGNDIIYLEADGIWSSRFAAARFATNLDGTSFLAEKVSLGGKNRFFDVVDGNADFDTIVLTKPTAGMHFFFMISSVTLTAV